VNAIRPANAALEMRIWCLPVYLRREGGCRDLFAESGRAVIQVNALGLAECVKSSFSRTFQKPLDEEQTTNYVLYSFMEEIMFRAVVEEAAALTSIALFVGMIAVWVQVLAAL